MSFNGTETSGRNESSITAVTRTSAGRVCSSMIPDQVLGKLFPHSFPIGEQEERQGGRMDELLTFSWEQKLEFCLRFLFFVCDTFIIASLKGT